MKIVYESRTGHTKKYAEMLGEELSIPVYTLKQATEKLDKEEEIIFLSWIYIEKLKGLEKIKGFKINCMCAIGDTARDTDYIEFLKKRNKINAPLFYLRGGIDFDKLNCIDKFLLWLLKIILMVKKNTDKELIEVLTKTTNYVSKDNLKPVIEFIKNN